MKTSPVFTLNTTIKTGLWDLKTVAVSEWLGYNGGNDRAQGNYNPCPMNPSRSETELLERARRLDQQALGEIHDRYYSEVYRYVRYRLAHQQLCEDITSEVFLRFLDALNRQRGPNTNLRGWLIGTASHMVNDHLRGKYRRTLENIDETDEHLLVDDHLPEDFINTRQENQEVRKAFDQLTTDQQHVLALRFGQELSLEETAKTVGKSVTAVKALQFRALAALRRILEQNKVEEL